MAQNNAGFPVENVAFLVSWLEEPCHFGVNPHAAEDATIAKSLRQIAAINDVIYSDTDHSFRIGTSTREPQCTSETTTTVSEIVPEDENETASLECGPNAPNAFISQSDVHHPGVAVLLNEYYKLLDDRPSGCAVSTTYRYQPSLMTHMWHVVTAKLPHMVRFSNVVRGANLLVEHVAPANGLCIVAFLVLWLVLLRLLLMQWAVQPAFFVALVCLGIYFLNVSDFKRKQAVRYSMTTSAAILQEAEVGENKQSLPPSALAYVDHKDEICTRIN